MNPATVYGTSTVNRVKSTKAEIEALHETIVEIVAAVPILVGRGDER